MKITKDNIGDVICLYKSGKRIMVIDVDDTHVHFLKENFAPVCVTEEFSVMGINDPSVDAKESFLVHQNYATILANAQASAYKQWFEGSSEYKALADKKIEKLKVDRDMFLDNLSSEALERKEMLLDAFLPELENIKDGQKMYFYKNKIEKASVIDGYVVNGLEVERNDIKNVLISESKPRPRKLSFDELVNSAQTRHDNAIDGNKPQGINKETFEIGQ